MNRLLTFVVLVVALAFVDQVLAGPCDGIDFDTVIFRDDFDTVPPCNTPDPSQWVVNHPIPPEQPGACWWVQGRTFFPNPLCQPDAPFPHVVEVENGRDNRACEIDHYHYNPYHLGTPKTTFLGGEIHTIMEFEPTRCYRFEARVRWPQAPRGLVTSFFTYGYDELHFDSDEIDFEYLSNEVFDPPHDVLTNTWDDSQQNHVQVPIPTLDITDWNVFRIYWCPATCVKWTWIDPATGDEMTLRTEETSCIPDEPMSLYFNFWAPTADWPKAYDAGLQPDQEDNGTKYEYLIDYAEVRIPEPAMCLLFSAGTVFLLRRRPRATR